MFKVIKFLFSIYVIGLAAYGSYLYFGQLSLSQPHVSYLQPKKECFHKGDWSFCTHYSAETNHAFYLYAFPDKSEDEHFWLKSTGYPALLQSYWQEHNKQTPLVISVSFKNNWLVTPELSKKNTGLLKRLEEEVFPAIESQVGTPSWRFLVGKSVGALNSLSLSLSLPNHFSRIALVCPFITPLSPYAGLGEIYHYMGKTGATPRAIVTMLRAGREYIASEGEWLKFSPLHQARQQPIAKHQKYYISVGLQDEYGLFQGASDFREILENQKISVDWHPSMSSHCGGDIPSLAEFLSVPSKRNL